MSDKSNRILWEFHVDFGLHLTGTNEYEIHATDLVYITPLLNRVVSETRHRFPTVCSINAFWAKGAEVNFINCFNAPWL